MPPPALGRPRFSYSGHEENQDYYARQQNGHRWSWGGQQDNGNGNATRRAYSVESMKEMDYYNASNRAASMPHKFDPVHEVDEEYQGHYSRSNSFDGKIKPGRENCWPFSGLDAVAAAVSPQHHNSGGLLDSTFASRLGQMVSSESSGHLSSRGKPTPFNTYPAKSEIKGISWFKRATLVMIVTFAILMTMFLAIFLSAEMKSRGSELDSLRTRATQLQVELDDEKSMMAGLRAKLQEFEVNFDQERDARERLEFKLSRMSSNAVTLANNAGVLRTGMQTMGGGNAAANRIFGTGGGAAAGAKLRRRRR